MNNNDIQNETEYMYGMGKGYYPAALEKSLYLIRQTVQEKNSDMLFYDFLVSRSPNPKQKDVLQDIRDEASKHFELLNQIYWELTGQEIKVIETDEFKKPRSYIRALEIGLMNALENVDKLRAIRQGLPFRKYCDMVFVVLSDQLKNASRYNYLFILNKR